MAIFEFRRNATVLIKGVRQQLLKRMPDGVWQLEDETSGRLSEQSEDQLCELLNNGDLQYAPDPVLPSASRAVAPDGHPLPARGLWDTASEADKAYARRALEYVKATQTACAGRTLMAETITRVARDTKDPNQPSVATVFRWRQSHTTGGRDIAALLPRFKARGNHMPRIPERIRTVLRNALDARYLTPERPTLQDTLEHAIDMVARINREEPEGDTPLPLPTLRMLRSVLKSFDPYEVCAARYGREYAQRKYHQSLGHSRADTGLARVEIDHTPINLMVIDERSFLPLGRPWLTLAIDVRHRTVQGFSLGFEPPSYLSVLRCLRHAIMPKSYLKAKYPGVRNKWCSHGVMESLGLDNGKEFHSKALEDFAARYGIALDYSPGRMPWFKGTVERFLGTINRGVAHGFPGTTFQSILERAQYDSTKTACITLAALREMVHIWIVDYYHQRVHRSLGVSPHASWTAEMCRRPIPLPTSAIELDQALAVPDQRQLSRSGIQLDHLVYNDPAVRALLVRGGGSATVDIRRSPEDMGHIYVLDKRADAYIRVPVIERFAPYAAGLSAWQHAVCVRYAKRHFQGRDDVVALSDAKERIRSVVARALHVKKASHRKWAGRFDHADTPDVQEAPQPLLPAPSKTPARRAAPPTSKAPKAPVTTTRPRELKVRYVSRRNG